MRRENRKRKIAMALAIMMLITMPFGASPAFAQWLGEQFFARESSGGYTPIDNSKVKTSKNQSIAFEWVDNEVPDTRPTEEAVKGQLALSFTISLNDEEKYTYELNEKNAIEQLGFETWNADFSKMEGTGTYDVYVKSLPSVITRTKTETVENEEGQEEEKEVIYEIPVTWSITPVSSQKDNFANYLEVKKSEAADAEFENLWVYREKTGAFFKVNIKQGNATTAKASDFEKDIKLYAKINGKDYGLGVLNDLDVRKLSEEAKNAFSYIMTKDAEGKDTWKAEVEVDQSNYALKNLPKYTDDKIEIIYYIKSDEQQVNKNTTTNDWYNISYNNNGVDNFSNNLDECYATGSVDLILAGETDYSATKLWLDDGTVARPETTFELWRYTNKGESSSYQEAARPNSIIDKVTSFDAVAASVTNKDNIQEIEFDKLDKYDADGYPYVYLTRETMDSGTSYVIVPIEEYTADGNTVTAITQENRTDSGDNSLYDGGVVANRVTGTVELDWKKVWQAAYYQNNLNKVEVTLGIRMKLAGEDDTKYQDVDSKYDVVINDFIAENLVQTGSLELPQYNELGLPLIYQCYEKSITEDGTTVTIDEDGKFILTCNTDDDYFVSTPIQNGNSTTVENVLKGTTTYTVDKIWQQDDGSYGKNAPEGASITVTLYQNGSRYEDVILSKDNDFQHTFADLPKYDNNGAMYSYLAKETVGYPGWSSEEYYKEQAGIYDCLIKNTKTGSGKTIWVKKTWLDGGDEPSRKKVTVIVYRVKEGEEDKEVAEVTLEGTDGWRKRVSITGDGNVGEGITYYVREKGIGTSSTADYTSLNEGKASFTMYDGMNEEAATLDHFTLSDGSEYVAYYCMDNGDYTVVNTRVGHIDYEVTKTWLDGNDENGTRPDKTFELELVPNDKDGYSNQVIEIGQDTTGGYVLLKDAIGYNGKNYIKNDDGDIQPAIQKVTSGNNIVYHFCNLPKYDVYGRVIHYQVIEKNLSGPYEAVYATPTFASGQLKDGVLSNDEVKVGITNQRVGTKTVTFNKIWKDEFAYTNGLRPDIYLDLYKKVGDTYVKIDPYPTRSWVRTSDYEWKCVFPDLPKYDENGAEIFYYAVENSKVDMAAIDYAPVELYTETDYGNGTKMTNTQYLPEDGYFVNRLQSTITISGKKVWRNVPAGTPLGDLPKLQIVVNRGTEKGNVTESGIASFNLQVDNYSGYENAFNIQYVGNNNSPGENPVKLPKYDADGKIYYYSISEKVLDASDAEIDSTTLGNTTYEKLPGEVNNFIITNTYAIDTKNTGKLSVVKNWDGLTPEQIAKYNYPAVQFKLYRHYISNVASSNTEGADGKPGTQYTKSELVETKVITAGTETRVSADFDTSKLRVYAPNGTLYDYYIEETILKGYDTTTGTVVSDEMVYTSEPVTLKLTINSDAKQLSFTNTYNPKEKVTIEGNKKWDDTSDVYKTRPAFDANLIQLEVYRYADVQVIEGADTTLTAKIEKEIVPASEYTITWTAPTSDHPDVWTYKIVGKTGEGIVGLSKYAPNGMPWKYIVKEVTPAASMPGYTCINKDSQVGAATEYTDTVNAIKMNDITNSLFTTASVKKIWSNSDNSSNLRPESFQVKLQFRIKDTADGWKDANKTNLNSVCGISLTQEPSFAETKTILSSVNSYTTTSCLPTRANGKELEWRFVEVSIGAQQRPVTCTDSSKDTLEYQRSGSYDPSQTWTAEGGTVITNELQKINLEVVKTWSDENNKYNTRPGSVEITLQRYLQTGTETPAEDDWEDASDVNGNTISHILTKEENWKFTFEDLRLYGQEKQAEGQQDKVGTYLYRAIEKNPADGYAVSIYEFNTATVASGDYKTKIENGLTNQSTIEITKSWLDSTGSSLAASVSRPAVTFEIRKVKNSKQESFTTPYRVTLDGNETTPWKTKVTGLPTLKDTTYIAVEVVKNADGTYSDVAPSGFVKSGENSIAKTDGTNAYTVTVNNQLTYILLDKKDSSGNAITSDYTVSYNIKSGSTTVATWVKTKQGTTVTEELKNVAAGSQIALVEVGDRYHLVGLPVGTYTVEEVNPPAGYELAASGGFTIKADGTVLVGTTTVSNHEIVLKDTPVQIRMKKTNAQGTAISAATFEVTGVFVGSSEAQTITVKSDALNSLDGKWIVGNSYTFKETVAPDGYKKSVCKATITIKADGTFTLVNSTTENAATIYASDTNKETLAFKNEKIQITFKKEDLSGNTLKGAQFKLTDTSVTPQTHQTVTLSNGTSALQLIQNHTYTLEETKAPDGYILSATPATVTFKVKEDGSLENVVIPESSTDYVTVTTATSTVLVKNAPIVFTINKWDSRGTALSTGFSFTVAGKFAGTTATSITVTPQTSQTASLIGGESYAITETTAPGGYTKLTSAIQLTANTDGTFTLQNALSGVSIEENKLKVVNTYQATGSFTAAGTKVLTGRGYETGETFTYSVKEGTTQVATGTSDSTGVITFTTINYSLSDVGTHTYTITENNTGKSGVTYDTTAYTVTVTVADKGDGTLTVTPAYPAAGVKFTNVYKSDGTFTPHGTKTLTGRSWKTGETFKFVVKEGENTVSTGTASANGNITFTTITYSLDTKGAHTYTISEVAGSDSNITYDSTTFTIKVNVVDKGNGELEVSEAVTNPTVAFTNAYHASGTASFTAEKVMNGRVLQANEFTFEIYEVAADNSQTLICSAKNQADGTIAFPNISYTQNDVGTHNYVMKEKTGTLSNVTYDTTEYNIAVMVSDNGDGTLTVNKPAASYTFTNSYVATGSASFSGTKTVVKNEITPFGFGIYSDAECTTRLASLSNTGLGVLSYTWNYNQEDLKTDGVYVNEKTFVYYLKESETRAKYTKDNTIYRIRVTVTNDPTNGQLNTVTAVAKKTADAADFVDVTTGDIQFVNVYHPTASLTEEVTKTLEGNRVQTIQDGEFEIVLTKLNADGSDSTETFTVETEDARFAVELDYTEGDIGKTYVYRVTETEGSDTSIVYDDSVYYLKVTVTDQAQLGGDLTVVSGWYKDEALTEEVTSPGFVNEYHASGAASFSELNKQLEGRTLTENEFTFELYDNQNQLLQTATNKADGSISFTPIEYTQDDIGMTYLYQIREVNTLLPGVTYDTQTISLEVKVTDAGEGNLQVKEIYSSPCFVNKYEATAVWDCESQQHSSGIVLTGKVHYFIKENGKVIYEGYYEEGGSVSLEELEFTLSDVGRHEYLIIEEGENQTIEYYAILDVYDRGDGTLTLQIRYSKPEVTKVHASKMGENSRVYGILTLYICAAGLFVLAIGRRRRAK